MRTEHEERAKNTSRLATNSAPVVGATVKNLSPSDIHDYAGAVTTETAHEIDKSATCLKSDSESDFHFKVAALQLRLTRIILGKFYAALASVSCHPLFSSVNSCYVIDLLIIISFKSIYC
jgi:hypothetical protein